MQNNFDEMIKNYCNIVIVFILRLCGIANFGQLQFRKSLPPIVLKQIVCIFYPFNKKLCSKEKRHILDKMFFIKLCKTNLSVSGLLFIAQKLITASEV